jgi:hypothetical protein
MDIQPVTVDLSGFRQTTIICSAINSHGMRLRIIRPLPEVLEGFNLAHLKFGELYEINPPLSDLLLITGYGLPEDEPPIDQRIALKAFATAIVAGDPVRGKPPAKRRKKTAKKAATRPSH